MSQEKNVLKAHVLEVSIKKKLFEIDIEIVSKLWELVSLYHVMLEHHQN